MRDRSTVTTGTTPALEEERVAKIQRDGNRRENGNKLQRLKRERGSRVEMRK